MIEQDRAAAAPVRATGTTTLRALSPNAHARQYVCFVTPYPITRVSGISQLLIDLARSMRQSGAQVVGCAPGGSDASSYEGIEAIQLRSKIFRDFELAARTAMHILRARKTICLVHAHQFHLQSVAALLMARLLGCGAVLTIHVRVEAAGRVRKLSERIIERLCLRYADQIVAVSPHVAATLPQRTVRVIPNGVDLSVFQASRADRIRIRSNLGLGSDKVVVFAGRWSRTKGLDTLFAAFAHVTSRYRGIQLVVIGEPVSDEPPIWPSTFMDQSALEHVRILGRLGATDEIAAHFSAADAFVLPSRSEGMPLALLEALASGLPIIASDIPIHRTLLNTYQCGWLVEPGNATELARALEVLIVDGPPAEWASRARGAAVKNHDIRVVARAYQLVYADVLEKHAIKPPHGVAPHDRGSDPY